MSREKQIEEMAHDICDYNRGQICVLDDKRCNLQCTSGKIAVELFAKGYRKIHDDHRKQISCYTLGCQEGDKIARQVAAEIFAEIESIFLTDGSHLFCNIVGYNTIKKKYESEKDNGKV